MVLFSDTNSQVIGTVHQHATDFPSRLRLAGQISFKHWSCLPNNTWQNQDLLIQGCVHLWINVWKHVHITYAHLNVYDTLFKQHFTLFTLSTSWPISLIFSGLWGWDKLCVSIWSTLAPSDIPHHKFSSKNL